MPPDARGDGRPWRASNPLVLTCSCVRVTMCHTMNTLSRILCLGGGEGSESETLQVVAAPAACLRCHSCVRIGLRVEGFAVSRRTPRSYQA